MKESQLIIESLKKLKPELTKRYFVSSIGLFGSIVRDDFSPPHSDVDIIVEFSKPVGIEFIDLAEYLESNIRRKVDLVSQKGIKPKYFEQIQKEILYV
ncbi:MAG: nucleotidyltransferase family protein [Bacteroidota bacterium]|nr:nucleotidyltransferase family protein [Bacteroidota bacterium]